MMKAVLLAELDVKLETGGALATFLFESRPIVESSCSESPIVSN